MTDGERESEESEESEHESSCAQKNNGENSHLAGEKVSTARCLNSQDSVPFSFLVKNKIV